MSFTFEPGAEPIPGYKLVKRLGEGGYGQVWQAEQGGFQVALKFVQLERTAASSVEKRALEIARAIRHPNLLSIFGAWQQDGYLVLAMELANGTLEHRMLECQAGGHAGIPKAELLGFLRAAAEGLDYLNARQHTLDGKSGVGVQHRDIKPANILLVGTSVKLGDFGLARILEGSVAMRSETGMSIEYAPPEFFDGRMADSSDQYSLGVTYAFLRTGKKPFSGSMHRIIHQIMHEPPDLSGLADDERPVVARAMAKNAKERWPSCRAFVQALEGGKAAKDAPFVLKPGLKVTIGYRLLEKLGENDSQEIWKAEQGGFSVSLKFVRAESAYASLIEAMLERTQTIRHPNLRGFFGAWQKDQYLILSTELSRGSLADRLAECKRGGLRGLPPDELLTYMSAAAEAIDYLNSRQHYLDRKKGVGIQHFDIRPQTLLLIGGSVKLDALDLAITMTAENEPIDRAGRGGVLWPSYCPPEAFKGHVCDRSDQYSLACAYVELRAGAPFVKGNSLNEIMRQHLQDWPDLSGLPDSERAPVYRALAKDPNERWSSCRAFVDALRETVGPARLPGKVTVRGYRLLQRTEDGARYEGWLAANAFGKSVLRYFCSRPEKLERAMQAARDLVNIKHPNIEGILFVDKTEDALVEGEADRGANMFPSMATLATSHSMSPVEPPSWLLRFFRQAASALDWLNAPVHAFGGQANRRIVHGILSPHWLRVEGDTVRVSGWALRWLTHLVGEANRSDELLNAQDAAVAFASPEALAGKPSPMSDQFSLCQIFLQLLLRTTADPRNPDLLPSDRQLPPAELAVVRQALDPDPLKRWPCCVAFVEALLAAQWDRPREPEKE